MSKAERYRQHADECSAFARTIYDPLWRGQLLAIAAQWRECAKRDSVEKRAESLIPLLLLCVAAVVVIVLGSFGMDLSDPAL
jgi:hypothetical protein